MRFNSKKRNLNINKRSRHNGGSAAAEAYISIEQNHNLKVVPARPYQRKALLDYIDEGLDIRKEYGSPGNEFFIEKYKNGSDLYKFIRYYGPSAPIEWDSSSMMSLYKDKLDAWIIPPILEPLPTEAYISIGKLPNLDVVKAHDYQRKALLDYIKQNVETLVKYEYPSYVFFIEKYKNGSDLYKFIRANGTWDGISMMSIKQGILQKWVDDTRNLVLKPHPHWGDPLAIATVSNQTTSIVPVSNEPISMISKYKGTYNFVHDKSITGTYNFDPDTLLLTYPDRINGTELKSKLIISKYRIPDSYSFFKMNIKELIDFFKPISSITPDFMCDLVLDSAIDLEIENPENADSFFVLPSQLNGAEYRSPEDYNIVRNISQYTSDYTGGPRGQLAVHPACGQFIIDNASNTVNKNGINAIKYLLEKINYDDDFYNFELINGYLKIPKMSDSRGTEKVKLFIKHLREMRVLGMTDIQVDGYYYGRNENLSTGTTRSDTPHNVNLIYASAIPINTYNNVYGPEEPDADSNIKEIANAVLFAQYYGAMYEAYYYNKQKSISGYDNKTKIFLMPLGGGVFNNKFEDITKCMLVALCLFQTTHGDFLERVDPKILAYNGLKNEPQIFKDILNCGQVPETSAHMQVPETTAHMQAHETSAHMQAHETTAHMQAHETTAHMQAPGTSAHMQVPETSAHMQGDPYFETSYGGGKRISRKRISRKRISRKRISRKRKIGKRNRNRINSKRRNR